MPLTAEQAPVRQTASTHKAGENRARSCDHRREGAVRFADGNWQCSDCGRGLQVVAEPKAWQVVSQISRCTAYCAILAAVVPAILCLFAAGPFHDDSNDWANHIPELRAPRMVAVATPSERAVPTGMRNRSGQPAGSVRQPAELHMVVAE